MSGARRKTRVPFPLRVPFRLMDDRADQVMRLRSRLHNSDGATREKARQESLDLADSIILRGDDPGTHLFGLVVGELSRCWDPDHDAWSHRVQEAEFKRAERAAAVAENKRAGVRRPVAVADAAMANRWGHNSGSAFRKSLHFSRVKLGLDPRSQQKALQLAAFLRRRFQP